MAGRKKSLKHIRKQCQSNYEFLTQAAYYGAPTSFIGKALLHKHEKGIANAHKRISQEYEELTDFIMKTMDIDHEQMTRIVQLEEDIKDLRNLVIVFGIATLGLIVLTFMGVI